VIQTHSPLKDVNPSAHVISLKTTGRQFPSPSEVYPLGQRGGNSVATVTGMQLPAPLLSYPDTQIFGTSIVTQTPSPSNLYPDGQVGDEIGVGATQFPYPSL
jgi:hypothetical protein